MRWGRPIVLSAQPAFELPYTVGMHTPPPPWLGRTADVSDTERYAAITPSERLECFVEVCELARAILEDRPDAREMLARTEPMPPAAERAWLRLVAEAQRAQDAR